MVSNLYPCINSQENRDLSIRVKLCVRGSRISQRRYPQEDIHADLCVDIRQKLKANGIRQTLGPRGDLNKFQLHRSLAIFITFSIFVSQL